MKLELRIDVKDEEGNLLARTYTTDVDRQCETRAMRDGYMDHVRYRLLNTDTDNIAILDGAAYVKKGEYINISPPDEGFITIGDSNSGCPQ